MTRNDFDVLVEMEYAGLLRRAERYTKDPDTAPDLVHYTILSILESEKYLEIESVQWLRNSIGWGWKSFRRVRAVEKNEVTGLDIPFKLTRYSNRGVVDLLSTLPPIDQYILTWCIIEERPVAEVARELKMTTAATEKRKQRALRRLQKSLKHEWGELHP